MKLRRVAHFALVLLLLIVTGCSKTEKKLVGKWQNVNLPESVQFLENKTGVFQVQDKPSLSFKWSVPGKDQVRLDFNMTGGTQSLTGRVENEQLILQQGNKRAEYKKIQ